MVVMTLCSFTEDYPKESPLLVFSLLPHEHKMSLVHIVLRKTADLARPIKSKDRLTFHVGCRRFTACPIFSQHTNGKKHKVCSNKQLCNNLKLC